MKLRPLLPEDVEAIRLVVEKRGLSGAARLFRVHPSTLWRALKKSGNGRGA